MKPGVPIDHFSWLGEYILDQRPDVIIHLGDHWDMPSLSQYDRGKMSSEGRRYEDDIKAGNSALKELTEWIDELDYEPEKYILMGNHEDRISRAIEEDPRLEGAIGYHDFELYGWTQVDYLVPICIDGVWYCLTPNHRVLRSDLTYVPLGEVRPGDKIIAFDEDGKRGHPRKYKEATVLASDVAVAEVFDVRLSTGKVFTTTSDHGWLARPYGTTAWRWVRTQDLRPGVHEVLRSMPEWKPEASYEAGYLGGILDGEGYISRPNQGQGGIQVAFAQKEGAVLTKALAILDQMGVEYKVSPTTNCMSTRILGPSGDKLSVLGRTGATRLIQKFEPDTLGRIQQYGDPVLVESVGNPHMDEIVMIKTSTNTMVVDGYAHHNCHYFYNPNTGRSYSGAIETMLRNIGHSFTMGHQQGYRFGRRELGNGQVQIGLVAGSFYQHDEEYKGPQGNRHWRGVVVKHEVKDGGYDPMFVSMDYLRRKYDG